MIGGYAEHMDWVQYGFGKSEISDAFGANPRFLCPKLIRIEFKPCFPMFSPHQINMFTEFWCTRDNRCFRMFSIVIHMVYAV